MKYFIFDNNSLSEVSSSYYERWHSLFADEYMLEESIYAGLMRCINPLIGICNPFPLKKPNKKKILPAQIILELFLLPSHPTILLFKILLRPRTIPPNLINHSHEFINLLIVFIKFQNLMITLQSLDRKSVV